MLLFIYIDLSVKKYVELTAARTDLLDKLANLEQNEMVGYTTTNSVVLYPDIHSVLLYRCIMSVSGYPDM